METIIIRRELDFEIKVVFFRWKFYEIKQDLPSVNESKPSSKKRGTFNSHKCLSFKNTE